LQALAIGSGTATLPAVVPMALPRTAPMGTNQRRLRDIESELIRKAVQETGGNVAQAALRLGVSRATVYRKLGLRKH
jgi:transcriptional regulator of acetoin/glycerol metabolism